MLGDDYSSEDDSDGIRVHESSQNSRAISGDDLGDFSPVSEGLSNKQGWVDKILEGEALDDEDVTTSGDSENSEEEDGQGEESDDDDHLEENDANADESSNRLSTRDWEQSDEYIDTELEEEDGRERLLDKKGSGMDKNIEGLRVDNINKHKGNTPPKQPPVIEKALPYVIDAPKSLEELSLLLNNGSDDEVVEAVSRIRKCNAIRLSAENRKKMQAYA